jgi:hypothetical protein
MVSKLPSNDTTPSVATIFNAFCAESSSTNKASNPRGHVAKN